MTARRLISIDDAAAVAAVRECVAETTFCRDMMVEADLTNVDDRIVRYQFSDGSVARDGHTIDQKGWNFEGFKSNPVFLWAHEQGEPPIGRVIEFGVKAGALCGAVQYIERDLYDFADMIFQMVKARYLNAVSTSWIPLTFKFSSDRERPGGIDFLTNDLLEISQVPVPAQIGAIATARAAGIDTSPMVEWAERALDKGGMILVPKTELEVLRREAKMPTTRKTRSKTADWTVGAARDLAIGEDKEWDGPAAAKAILSACGFDGDEPDTAKAAKYFLAHDRANPSLKGSYKFAFAEKDGDEFKAMPAGIRACASRLPDSDLPQAVKDEADGVIKAYEKKMGIGEEEKQAAKTHYVRGLCEVSDFAWFLGILSWIVDAARWEADLEQDGSDIPERLVELMNTAGLILVDMTKEEVAELIASKKPPEDVDVEAMIEQASTSGQKMMLRMAAAARAMKGTTVTVNLEALVTRGLADLMLRAGKVLSAANVEVLKRAMDHHRAMGECVQSLLDLADPDKQASDEDQNSEDQAARARRATALRHKHTTTSAAA